MSGYHFKFMSFGYKFRDFFLPRKDILDEVGIKEGFHDLSDPNGVLKELHRVLKPKGILSFSDHHLEENEIVAKLTNKGLFRLSGKGKRTYSFPKGV